LELWPALRTAYVEPTELAAAVPLDTAQPFEQVLAQAVRAVRDAAPAPVADAA
jgi:hypothetical protein